MATHYEESYIITETINSKINPKAVSATFVVVNTAVRAPP